jgi:RNA polymerase sigma-70 factor (ECF subfamily)
MPDQLSDAILLDRFVSFREEAAFRALVERHGPLVQRICRRVLRNEHDVEDVFQATFLVLARRASGIAWRESVAGWLGAVAHRLALGARADLNRHNRRETAMTALLDRRMSGRASLEASLAEECHRLADPSVELERREAGRLINDELLLLPAKYRSPVVLCYLEGRTHEEAARELGWPAGSMSRRLKRAQTILRRRLIHRGFALSALLFALAFAVFGGWIVSSTRSPNAAAVRSAMASLEPLTDGEHGIQAVIARIDPANADRELERIIAVARQATRVAEEIEGYEPGNRQPQWRQFLAEMRTSAALLAQATSESDRASMRRAAGRLSASCVGCHQAFCSTDRESAPDMGSLLPEAEITRPQVSNRSDSWFIFDESSSPATHGFDPQKAGTKEVALLLAQR